jgi:ankyrin repeat protein
MIGILILIRVRRRNLPIDSGRELRLLADAGNLEELKILLKQGVDINACDSDGYIALHYAMNSYPHQKDKDHLGIVRCLVEHGADIHAASKTGQDPLFYAAAEGLCEVVVFLHRQGGSLDARLESGVTALFVIAEEVENRPLNFTVTVERDGQKIVLTDPDEIRAEIGSHPDDEYDRYMQTAGYLIDHGADLKARLHETDQDILNAAAGRGVADMVRMVLEKDPSGIDNQDKWGLAPLHYACRNGHLDVVEELLKAGANVNAVENYGFTPLHEAAENGRLAVAQTLIEGGADPGMALNRSFSPYRAGDTPLDVARKAGQAELVEYLREITL